MERRGTWAWAGLALCSLLAACGLESRQVYDVTGVVQSVDAPTRQITIAHDDIPGFMPAMTMNFDAAPGVALAGLEPGARIRFQLERTGTALGVIGFEQIGTGEVRAGAGGVVAPQDDETAPEFSLLDQDGKRFSLADLRGSAVLLDFIFTRCAGPCPMLTSRHVAVQRRLPESARAHTHFVSISVDPEYDRPHRLREYALARGVDLRGWSLLTGDAREVRKILAAYGISAERPSSGELEHTVATFLIDPQGRIAERHLGLQRTSDQLLQELEAIQP